MGELGITFPFLIGSLAYKAGQPANVEQAQKVLDDMVRHPVESYVVEISWCSNIVAPVLNTKRIDSPYRMQSKAIIPRPYGNGQSIVFGVNLSFQWRLKDGPALLRRLLQEATEPISKGCYSRIRKEGTLDFEYDHFLPKELQFIENTIMVTSGNQSKNSQSDK